MSNSVIDIVACGDSAQDWEQHDYSIGVNDSWKWGKPTDALVVCNRPTEFRGERLQTIISSKPKVFYSHKSNWSYVFPEWKKLSLIPWYGTFHDYPDKSEYKCYTSNTSPIIAVSLAYRLGAKDIVLWGVDFTTHKMYHKENPATQDEVNVYLQIFQALKEKNVNVWLGKEGGVFDNLIPLYEKNINSNSVNHNN